MLELSILMEKAWDYYIKSEYEMLELSILMQKTWG
jgi:hypothetical protein